MPVQHRARGTAATNDGVRQDPPAVLHPFFPALPEMQKRGPWELGLFKWLPNIRVSACDPRDLLAEQAREGLGGGGALPGMLRM